MRWLFALALMAGPAAAQDYSPVIIPGQIIGGPETMTPLNGGDDSTRLVQLGFPFQYFGQTFNQAWVSSNGFISFADIGNRCCNGEPIEQAPRNAIYGLWTDLVSGGNPYFRTDTTAAIFGWYNTYEYGSGLTNTFEIAIYPDGKIQWNYGDVNNRWHVVTAGLTGPSSTDSFSILYGQNVNLLDNTSYIALGLPEEPEPVFSPVVIGPSISAAPVIVAVQEAVEATSVAAEPVSEPVAEPVAVAEVETRAEAVAEPVAEIAQETVQVAAQETKAETKQEAKAERLSPAQLAALSSGRLLSALLPSQAMQEQATQETATQEAANAAQQESGQQNSAQTTQETAQQATTAQEAQSEAVAVQEMSNVSERALNQTEMVFSAITPQQAQQLLSETKVTGGFDMMNPATQLQILEMMAERPSESQPAEVDAEVQQLSGNVNLVQYAQANIPDAPFYNEREIYRKNRPVDAYLVMYRLMMNNDRRWLEMIGQQYER